MPAKLCAVLVCAESIISQLSMQKRIFQLNHFSLFIRGPVGLDSWKKGRKISWHCHFKAPFENMFYTFPCFCYPVDWIVLKYPGKNQLICLPDDEDPCLSQVQATVPAHVGQQVLVTVLQADTVGGVGHTLHHTTSSINTEYIQCRTFFFIVGQKEEDQKRWVLLITRYPFLLPPPRSLILPLST